MTNPPAPKTVRVLLVDEDPDVRPAIAAMLTAAGYDVVDLGSGVAALSLFATAHFDVVIADMLMSDVDGVEIVQAVRKASPRCRIIAISGGSARMPAAVGLRRAEAFGADVVLYKPFARAELLAAVGGLAPPP